MSDARHPDDLQVEEDLAYQRRAWHLQRVAWSVLTLVLLGVVAGLAGQGGPLSRASAGERGTGLWVEYERMGRVESPGEMHVHADTRFAQQGRLTLRIDRGYLRDQKVEAVIPQPLSAQLEGDSVEYAFAVTPGGGEVTVTFYLQPQSWGAHHGNVAIPGGGKVAFTQWVYP